MNINKDNPSINLVFYQLPEDVQKETLALIETVNARHLHCGDAQLWPRIHNLITQFFSSYYLTKQEKKEGAGKDAQPIAQALKPQVDKKHAALVGRAGPSMFPLSLKEYYRTLDNIRKELETTFHDTLFTAPILEALQQHILTPLCDNAELVFLLCHWIFYNAKYLPLGPHLLNAYKEDMEGTSDFFKFVLTNSNMVPLSEALSQKAIAQMNAFLAEAAQAHCRSCVPVGPASGEPTAVMLSVRNGAGGHTAPSQAMETRLKTLGWRVVTIHYDIDLSEEDDPFQLLGITFEDGSPMTQSLISTRWVMQKRNREVRRIVHYYVGARKQLAPDLFEDNSGGDLLRNKILPLNPQLLVTTLAYHWSWKSVAYRVTGAKTLLVASDVFFHREAIDPWYRQKALAPEFRQIQFTAMTDDIELLRGMGKHHDLYYINKYPGTKIQSYEPLFRGLQLDDQITVIGAPIHPAFDAITDPQALLLLRQKWNVPEGAISICLSRGKLGYDIDLLPALEGYRTSERLPKPVILHVVCGENVHFYEQLAAGSHADLAPSITIVPHPLLKPSDFAELRAISTLDDIKAGGGSTFEGWYLISKGTASMLLLTPGLTLWWERSNCDAMEKWGVGRTVLEGASKIPVLKEVLEKGLPQISQRFPDWKQPFDRVVQNILKEKAIL